MLCNINNYVQLLFLPGAPRENLPGVTDENRNFAAIKNKFNK